MQPNKTTGENDVKALFRALEDRMEAVMQLTIRKEFLERDAETYKQLADNEDMLNLHLKENIKQLDVSTEREQLNVIERLSLTYHKGSMIKIASFSEEQVAQIRESRTEKEAAMKNKLKQHIDGYTRTNPKVAEYQRKEAELDELETQLKSLLEEKRIFTEKAQKAKQVKSLLFQQYVVELAQQVLRYNNVIEKMKNPGKKGSVVAPPKMLVNNAKVQCRSESQFKPVPKSNENPTDDPEMPETVATSKHQETIDTNVEDQASVRSFASRPKIRSRPTESKMNQRNEVAGNEQPAKSKVANTPSVMENVKDDNKEKGQDAPKQTKELMPNATSLKRSIEATNSSSNNQKSKRGKVTFVDFDSPSSNSDMDCNRDEGVTSSKAAATNDIEIETPLENGNGMQMDGRDEANDPIEEDGANNQMSDDENNFDLDIDLNIDDNDGNISTWTPLETGRNNMNAGSPESYCSYDDFVPLQKSNDNSKPTSNSPFDMNYGSDEMDAEMGDFFNEFSK